MAALAKLELRQRQRRLRRLHAAAATPGLLGAALAGLPPLLPPDRRLGLYWPIGAEPDLRPLADLPCLAERLALPAVAGAVAGGHGRLLYRAWRVGDPLEADACAIPAPLGPELDPQRLGLLLVPALALDRRGIRLGSGGGWYDRLRADPAWRALPALAVLPSACLIDRLPEDPWDIPFDGWIDETGLHRLAGGLLGGNNVASS
jgi:5-formyltetrahydrofolate cyclo-ligase